MNRNHLLMRILWQVVSALVVGIVIEDEKIGNTGYNNRTIHEKEYKKKRGNI